MDGDLSQLFFGIPPITRTFLLGVLGTTLAVQFHYISPLKLYFNASWIVQRQQYWRLVSSFFFFGNLSFDFFFHVFFILRYSKMLEEGSEWFRRRPGEYLWFMLLMMTSLVGLSLGYWAVMQYVLRINTNTLMMLSQSLSSAIVYLWSRRNPAVHMSFLGVFTFKAPFLPFVLLGLSLIVSNSVPVDDLLGIFVSHLYYFGQDTLPQESRRQGLANERRWFNAPHWFRSIYCFLTGQATVANLSDNIELVAEEQIQPVEAPHDSNRVSNEAHLTENVSSGSNADSNDTQDLKDSPESVQAESNSQSSDSVLNPETAADFGSTSKTALESNENNNLKVAWESNVNSGESSLRQRNSRLNSEN